MLWLFLVCLQSLITFANKHLNRVNLEVSDLDTQFHDGVYLILLLGSLEGFFVPLYDFYLTPHDAEQKVHNVSFAFELMQDIGLARPKARPEGKIFFISYCPSEKRIIGNTSIDAMSTLISKSRRFFESNRLTLSHKSSRC